MSVVSLSVHLADRARCPFQWCVFKVISLNWRAAQNFVQLTVDFFVLCAESLLVDIHCGRSGQVKLFVPYTILIVCVLFHGSLCILFWHLWIAKTNDLTLIRNLWEKYANPPSSTTSKFELSTWPKWARAHQRDTSTPTNQLHAKCIQMRVVRVEFIGLSDAKAIILPVKSMQNCFGQCTLHCRRVSRLRLHLRLCLCLRQSQYLCHTISTYLSEKCQPKNEIYILLQCFASGPSVMKQLWCVRVLNFGTEEEKKQQRTRFAKRKISKSMR